MNLVMNLDKVQQINFSPLASHTSVWSLDEPYRVSGLVNLPKPIYSTLNVFLKSKTRAVQKQAA